MKYRVLRYFPDDPFDVMLIGHFDLKMKAREAAHEDQLKHPNVRLEYKYEEVEIELSQAEIDAIMAKARSDQGSNLSE